MSDNIDDIIRRIRSNSKEANETLAEELKSRLSAEQTKSLNKLLSDKELMKKMMCSDEVKRMMEKLGGDKNGHK
ncbi:MAG: hypothetical protein IKV76_09610 [Clostridia bacterium]|nr:hypothetical protein [Clostridia bacterium]